MNLNKVIILSNSDSGLYQFRKELIETLVTQYEVVCCVPNSDGYVERLESLGCRCIIYSFDRRGVNPFHDLKLIAYYRNLIKHEKPHVVLTYTIKPNVYGGMVSASLKVPYITNITGLGDSLENGGLLQKISLRLYKLGLRRANCVFFQNSNNRQFFEQHKIIKDKARTIPGSGVNLLSHCYEDYPSSSEIRLLFVARVKKEKGIEELIEAIKNVRKTHPDCCLEIVGGCEGDYLNVLKAAEARGDIRYYGHQDNMHSFYKNAHCVVLPSYHEGTSNVLLEGAATGRPLIATDVPGCKEIFDEGKSGFGCTPRDPVSLANAITSFLELPLENKKKMGLEARKKVEREYDRNIVIKAYTEEIDKAIKYGGIKHL